MIRVWFNHWFSTAYHIINLIKQDTKTKFYVIGTHPSMDCVIRNVCDEWYREPESEGEEYLFYCLSFCREHKIQVFVPRKNMLLISKNKKRFEEIGVKVLAEEEEILRDLQQKNKAYEKLKDMRAIPEYRVVTNAEEFEKAYQKLKNNYEQIIFKFVEDEGARSFRIIDNTRKGYPSLLQYSSARISFHTAYEALKEKENFPPLLVMPYLSGREVSVDCLQTKQGLIAIPRIKGRTRAQKIEFIPEVLELCREFYQKIKLEFPCNIQFRYLNNVPYLLEVNTRMSGGIFMSCFACNINIPNIAIYKLMGIEKEWKITNKNKIITQIETPQIMEIEENEWSK